MRSLRVQLIAIVLFTTLAPLFLVSVASWWMIDEATRLGFHPEVEEGLRLGAEQARERHRAERTAVRAALEVAALQSAGEAEAECAPIASRAHELGLNSRCVVEPLTEPLPESWLAREIAEATDVPAVVSDGARGQPFGTLRTASGVLLLWFPQKRPAAETFEQLRETGLTYTHLALQRSGWARRLLWAQIAFGVLLGGAALLAGRALAARILGPVERLMEGVELLGSGQLELELGPRPHTELGTLMGALERTGRELRQSRERIVFLDKVAHWQEAARRLAHEIQNPLTPLQLICQELRAKYRADEPGFGELLDSSVSLVEEEVAALRRLVQTFSSFARLPEPQLQEVDLMAVLRSFVEWRQPVHPLVDLKVIGPESHRLLCDADLVRQVLRNLLDNSVAAMDGRGVVELELRRPPESETAELRVRDSGPGVPAELRDHLFDPYVSGRNRGSGLGLAICRKIAYSHGWEIDLLPGSPGAEFRVELRE